MTGNRLPSYDGLPPNVLPWARAITEYVQGRKTLDRQFENAISNANSAQAGIFTAIENQAEQINQVQEDTGTAPGTTLGDPTVPILSSSAATVTVVWDGQYVDDGGPSQADPRQIGYMVAEASLTVLPPYDPEAEPTGGEPEPDPFVRVGTPFRSGGTQFLGSDIGAMPGDTVYVRLRPFKTDGTEGEPGEYASVTLAGVAAGDLDQSVNEFLNELEQMAGAAVVSAQDEYAVSASATTPPTSGWSTTVPEWSTTNYIWRRVRYFYADDTETITEPAVLTGNPGAPGTPGTPGAPGQDGAPGSDATSVMVGNEAVVIPTNSSGAASAAQTITVPFSGWIGNARAATTVAVSGLPTGMTVTSNTPATTSADGALVLTVANGSTLGGANSGQVNLAVTVNSKTFDVKLSWAKSRQGTQGTQGNQGIPGTPGADGITYYTWLKYADTPTSGMSDSPTGKTYMGIAYNKTSPTESSNYSDYSWSLIQGPKGDTGAPGEDGDDGAPGKGVSTTDVTYTKSTNGTTAPTSGWGTSIPATVVGEFLWTRTVTTYTDATTSTAYSVAAHGATGPQGNTGSTGRGISNTVVNYAKSTNGTTAPTTGWSTSIPTTTAGEYLWTRTVITYTSGSPATTTAYAVAAHGATGSQGIQGPPGEDGQPTYTWIKYADNASGGGMSDSPTGKTYIGLAHNKSTATESNTPGDYSWALIQGPKGDQGDTGAPGQDGSDGADGRGIVSTTITYQAGSSGTATPTGTWLTSVPTVSAGQYLWTRTVITYTDSSTSTAYSVGRMGTNGSQGTPGAPGADGQTSYLHVAYATNSTGTAGFSTTDPSGKTYMGTYTDFTAADSTDPSKYDWVLIKGADGSNGADGATGAPGKGISSSVVTYQASASATTAPTGTWNSSVPAVTPGQYLWTRTVLTFTDGASTTTYSVARQGVNGSDGAPGKGISSTAITYQVGSSGTTAPTGTWNSSVPSVPAGQFLWTRTILTYTDSTTATAYSVSRAGTNGAQGTPGADGADGQTSYLHVAYATNSTGTAGFSTTDPSGKTYMGTYTDFTQADSTDPSKYKWAKIQGPQGDQGNQGVPGQDGAPGAPGTGITSSNVRYQVSSSGTVVPTGSWLSSVPSTVAGQFLWTRTTINFSDGASQITYSVSAHGAKGDTGAPGQNGSDGSDGASISTITRFYYLTAGSAPAKPTAMTPPAPWSTTEPTYTPGSTQSLYTTDRTVLSNGTFFYSNVSLSSSYDAAKAAYNLANNALTSANGKNKVVWSTSAASGTTGYSAGDTWFQTNAGVVIAQWEFTTSWQKREIGHQTIASVDAGKISVGYLDVLNRVQAGAITTDKLLVGDFENYFRDTTFSDPRGYPGVTGAAGFQVVNGGLETAVVGQTATQPSHTDFAVVPGEQFVFSMTVGFVAGTPAVGNTVIAVLDPIDASGNVMTPSVAAITAANGGTFEAEGTVPTGAVAIRVGFAAVLTSGRRIRITNVVIRRKLQGRLIVDGTLSANALEAGSITTEKLEVGKFGVNLAPPLAAGNIWNVSGATTITYLTDPTHGPYARVAASSGVPIPSGLKGTLPLPTVLSDTGFAFQLSGQIRYTTVPADSRVLVEMTANYEDGTTETAGYWYTNVDTNWGNFSSEFAFASGVTNYVIQSVSISIKPASVSGWAFEVRNLEIKRATTRTFINDYMTVAQTSYLGDVKAVQAAFRNGVKTGWLEATGLITTSGAIYADTTVSAREALQIYAGGSLKVIGSGIGVPTLDFKYKEFERLHDLRGYGTFAQRVSPSNPISAWREGATWFETDTGLNWIVQGGAWKLVPGQVLGDMFYTTTVSNSNGGLVGSIVSTPVLPVGQRIKVTAAYTQYASITGQSSTQVRVRNSASNVTYTTYDTTFGARGYSAAGGSVTNASTPSGLFTTTVAAKVSAGLYLDSATSGVYGADGISLWIESA